MLLLSAAITGFTFYAPAQVQHSGWLASFNTFSTGKKTSIHFDGQWRSSGHVKNMQTLLLRGGFNYKISSAATLTGGYAYILNRKILNGITGYAPEHRLWQQALLKHKLKKIEVTHRFRTEQRFMANSSIQNNRFTNEGSNYASRFRYFIRNVLPLASAENGFSKGMFASLQNELFLNVGNTQTVNGKTFDQNRLYLALGYKLNKRYSFDVGYLNQYINGKNNAFTNNHIVQLAAYTSL